MPLILKDAPPRQRVYFRNQSALSKNKHGVFLMNGPTIATYGFLVISAILLGFAAVVLWKIISGEIELRDLIAEAPPPGSPPGEVAKASLSRFQFLVFTFVVAGLFLLLSIEAGSFVDIPSNVLGLLGISGGSYVVSKAVGQAKPTPPAAGPAHHDEPIGPVRG